MLSDRAVMETAERLAQAASQPASVIVFGSYARGDADEGSDLVPGTLPYWARKVGRVLHEPST